MIVNRFGFLALVLATLSFGVQAQSELDGKKAPGLIVSQLNPQTNVVTDYKVDQLDASLKPEALAGLSEVEREARVKSFLDSVAKPENKIREEQVELKSSELDNNGSTSAHGWRWRGRYSYRYYGTGFYYNYYNYNYYYRPVWGWNGYNGWYTNSYYRYYPTWNDCYYTVYGWGW